MQELTTTPVIRINRFAVPPDARGEFMELIKRTHEVMRAQPGVIDEMILEQRSGAGPFNLMTIIQFEGEHVLQPVIAAIARSDAEAGIDRHALSRRLGVEIELGFYQLATLAEPVAA